MRRSQGSWTVAMLLVVLCFVVYHSALSNGFVSWDDESYVSGNPHVRAGLCLDSIIYAFTTFDVGNYIPVTWLSYELDATLFGVDAEAFHGVNVLLHALNSVLLFVVCRQWTGDLAISAFTAALFAVHPLHVESVAWVSERKDLLSAAFLLLTLLAFGRLVEAPSRERLILVVVLFAAGLLSKPMLVTCPVLLVLIDVFVLHRLNRDPKAAPTNQTLTGTRATRLLKLGLEKWPLFMLSLVVGLVTIAAQKSTAAFGGGEYVPFPVRLANMVRAYGWYVVKTIWPTQLSPLYLHPEGQISPLECAAAALLLVIVTVLVVRVRRTSSIPLFGWLWFLIALLPTVGLLQVGSQAQADRYVYIPHIGLLLMLAALACQWSTRLSIPTLASRLIAAAILVAASIATDRQVRIWHDTESLWAKALEVEPASAAVHYHLGNYLARIGGRVPEAKSHLRFAFDTGRHRDDVLYSMGRMYDRSGQLEEAAAFYRQALDENPHHTLAGVTLADVNRRLKGDTAGEADLRRQAEQNPNSADAWSRLGLSQMRTLQVAAAIESFTKAVRANPNDFSSRTNLGLALWQANRLPEAVEQLRRAVDLAKDNPNAHVNLADALQSLGSRTEAIEHLREAVRLNPKDHDARKRLSELAP